MEELSKVSISLSQQLGFSEKLVLDRQPGLSEICNPCT
jgi:hypothetical protein